MRSGWEHQVNNPETWVRDIPRTPFVLQAKVDLLPLRGDVKVLSMLSLLIELQRLKRLDRTGWTLRGLPNGTESVAAHSFGVSVTAMLLADLLVAKGASLDIERVLRISLLHDWAEARVGDMPRTATEFFGA